MTPELPRATSALANPWQAFRRAHLYDYPLSATVAWLLITGLALGPMGAAFVTWYLALRDGDPRRIGALAYLTPLLSTLLLVWLR